MKGRQSYPKSITIVAGVFIVTILCIALINLYVSIELRGEYLASDRSRTISVIGLCVDTWSAGPGADQAVRHAQVKKIMRLFGIDRLVITDTLGAELYNSLTLPVMSGFEPLNDPAWFGRKPGPDELVQKGNYILYHNAQPPCFVYLQQISSYTVIDRAFKWHMLFITVLLVAMALLGVFLVRNLLLPMRYVARVARDFGIEVKKEDFVNETFQEVYNKLRSREKTLVEFSAYLAHEFRNSLATITGLSRLVEKGKRKADDIIRECRSMDDLISAILEFSRPVKPVFSECEAAKLVRDAVARAAVPSRISVELNVPPGCSLNADCDLLAVALANLIKNSIEAIAGEGRILVKAWAGRPDGDHVLLTIEDTGSGIASNEIDRIFMPFFSTKDNGFGLGLAYVKKVVELHEGRIDVRSEPGKGTEFAIVLPREPRGGGRT